MGTYRARKTQRYILICVAGILVIYCGNQLSKLHSLQKDFQVAEQYEEYQGEVVAKLNKTVARLPAEYLNETMYPIFQSIEEVEFPTVKGGSSRIPHIIHQIYTSEYIPDNFILPMQSFVRNNPEWKYMFWTYENGHDLIAEYHPYLVDAYDKFGDDVKKSDMLRYAILYELGGFYSDLDVKNVRPLDFVTKKYACVIPTETFDHSTILNHRPLWLNTAVLMCRPKHPFFKLLLNNLRNVDVKCHAVFATGPGYITKIFMKYNNLTEEDLYKPKIDNDTNSPNFYKGERHAEDKDGLYIPNSQYFMDTVDPLIVNENGDLKPCVDGRKLSYLAKRGCAEFEHRRKVRKNRKYTFTVHYWFHLWLYSDDRKKAMRFFHIKDIIPQCVLYDGVL